MHLVFGFRSIFQEVGTFGLKYESSGQSWKVTDEVGKI